MSSAAVVIGALRVKSSCPLFKEEHHFSRERLVKIGKFVIKLQF